MSGEDDGGDAPDDPQSERPSAAAPSAAAIRRARVLVIDDEILLGRSVRRILSEHDVVIEVDGRAALVRLAAGERFDVIICDLRMPTMSGAEVFATAVALDPEAAARFVFLTGDASPSWQADFPESVDNEVVAKPFEPARLRALVLEHLLTGARGEK
jgi:CheY-like chemotaxis protein